MERVRPVPTCDERLEVSQVCAWSFVTAIRAVPDDDHSSESAGGESTEPLQEGKLDEETRDEEGMIAEVQEPAPEPELDPLMSDEELRIAGDAVREIESALRNVETVGERSETSFEFPLQRALDLMPASYRADGWSGSTGNESITISVDDLFEQLASGRVCVPVASLALDMPAGSVVAEAHRDSGTLVALPLSAVVGAISPSVLAKRTPSVSGSSAVVAGLPDPFGEMDDAMGRQVEIPELEAPVAEVKAKEAVKPVRALPVDDNCAEPEPPERLGGVNLNTATAEQLQTLKGVSPAVARRVVEYREAHGPFKSIFDLKLVPQVGRVTFRRMTGMPYNDNKRHRIRKLVKLLGVAVDHVHNLRALAERVVETPGFSGCVISDEEGLLVAECGALDCATELSAIVPRMYRQVDENLAETSEGAATTLSVGVSDRMFTIVRRGKVFLSAIHSRKKLTKGQLLFAERVAEELAWLLSRRAYVGPCPAG